MLKLLSSVTENNEAKLTVEKVDSILDDTLKPDEVIVRIEAAPVNPSDLALLAPPGTDEEALSKIETTENNLKFPIAKKFSKYLAPRVNKSTPCGLEGAGVVVRAGSSKEAQALLNRVVSISGQRGTYSQFMKSSVNSLLPHLEGTTPAEAASSCVNPVTAVCIVHNVKSEGHKALIHTAAASQLGIMLVKLCQQENLPIVNVVRKQSQEDALKAVGAKYIVRSDKQTFMPDLINAIAETKATCAFDAIGGGDMADKLLIAMEQAAQRDVEVDPASFYGSPIFKQVYVYGGLDRSPTLLRRGYGMSWGISGWLMPRYLSKLSKEKIMEMYGTVAKNIKTVFKTEYYKQVSLEQLLEIDNFLQVVKQETGRKFLVVPHGTNNSKI